MGQWDDLDARFQSAKFNALMEARNLRARAAALTKEAERLEKLWKPKVVPTASDPSP